MHHPERDASNQVFANSKRDAVEQKKTADKVRGWELELHRGLILRRQWLSVTGADGRYTCGTGSETNCGWEAGAAAQTQRVVDS
jgi:hypothetical protein